MKVVINACFGGFSLSEAGVRRYAEIKGIPLWVEPDKKYSGLGIIHYYTVPLEQRVPDHEGEFHSWPLEKRKAYNEACAAQSIYDRDIPRDDPALVQVVEELGERANGCYASLRVVEIPDGTDWEIDEYDGSEHIAEKHRTWS